ncbi:MAG: hypothetical protein ABR583_10670 [Gaiellaceae bacterium]
MSDERQSEGLSPEELEAQAGAELPDREVMSVIAPDPHDRLAMDLIDGGPSPDYGVPPEKV